MKFKKAFIAVLLIAAFLLQACGASEVAVATSVAATLQISQLETAAAGGGQAPTGNTGGDNGQAGTEGDGAGTATPTLTPSPTSGVPLVSVSSDTNCRRGPRIDYDYVTVVEVGQEVEVLKTFPGEDYVVVRNPNGSGDCWLWLRYASQTDFSGYDLPVATQPPTPTPSRTPTATATATPVYVWSGSWTIYVNAVTYTMTVNQSGNSFSATFDAGGGTTVTLTGTLSADWRQASGNWSSSAGPTGTFAFRMMDNLNQFQGNIDGGTGPWCGARGGAGAPGTCQWP